MKTKKLILLYLILVVSFSSLGCDAFVRKFTRKPKKDDLAHEELVVAPEEYKDTMTKDDRYRQYFLFWKSWQDELIEALNRGTNHKKQMGCIAQAIKNLILAKALLIADQQKKLDMYLTQLNDLNDSITQDSYGNSVSINRGAAERIKRNILRDFSYPKIKDKLL